MLVPRSWFLDGGRWNLLSCLISRSGLEFLPQTPSRSSNELGLGRYTWELKVLRTISRPFIVTALDFALTWIYSVMAKACAMAVIAMMFVEKLSLLIMAVGILLVWVVKTCVI